MGWLRFVVILAILSGVARAEPLRAATGYRNGHRIKLEVVDIGWATVEVKTARAFVKMRDAAAADGVELEIWSGFRTYERQAELYAAWRKRMGNEAAPPGYSNHQSGRALDLVVREEATWQWLEKHARRFGFRRTVKREPWHWEYSQR
ncbi:MAG: D-alanyl-D-alanine carboxypeptidase family protein [Kofleriaceae bacterium]